MATERRKTRGELWAMFWHDFAGTIADNMVEVNWLGWGLAGSLHRRTSRGLFADLGI